MICPLCQFRFDESSACHECGFSKGCALVRCPNCGYEFVEKSKTVSFVNRIFERLRKQKREEEEK